MLMSVSVWFALTVFLSTLVAVTRVSLAKRTARRIDLGAVSYQWINEQQVGSRDNGTR
jgi:hypothetical protein